MVARHLDIRGIACRVLLLSAPAEIHGDARANLEVLKHSRVPIVDLTSEAEDSSSLRQALAEHARGATWLVDALLGTGSQGPPRPPYDVTLSWMNEQACRKLAVDVPSGLDCDSGQAAVPAFRADVTCTFVAEKVGFSQPESRQFTGTVHVVSIGIPPGSIHE